MVASVGTEATSSHFPKSTLRACSAASETPIGLTDVAVSHRAEETARLAMPQIDALARPALDHGLRHQEGDHDQQHTGVGETGESLGWIKRVAQHCNGAGQKCRSQQRIRIDDDGGREVGEQVSGFARETFGGGREPDADAQQERRRAFQHGHEATLGRAHGFPPAA